MLLDTRAKVDVFTKFPTAGTLPNYPQFRSYARISMTFDQYHSFWGSKQKDYIGEFAKSLIKNNKQVMFGKYDKKNKDPIDRRL